METTEQKNEELGRIVAAHELRIRQLSLQLARSADEIARLREENSALFVYHVDNVLPVPEWAVSFGGGMSNSAVLNLIRNEDLTSVQKGTRHFIVMTEKTLAYRKSNRGPKSGTARSRVAKDKAS